MTDETVLAFTGFVALAQVVVGLVLLVVGSSTATRIIGLVIVLFGLISASGPVMAWRRRSQELAGDGPPANPEAAPAAAEGQLPLPSSQGPRQPPNPEASRSPADGPQDPVA
jgi:hypothetical protein